MLIHWIVDGIKGDAAAGFSSSLASNRYRVIIPAAQLRREGHTVVFIPMSEWATSRTKSSPPDVCVIGKLLPNNDPSRFERLALQVLDGITASAAQGITTVADFSDDHFDNPQVGAYWRALAAHASVCTAGSDVMAQAVQSHSQGPVTTVGDPLASPPATPRVFQAAKGVSAWTQKLLGGSKTRQRLKLVWYGNNGNWPAMQQWADALGEYSSSQPMLVWIVTRPNAVIENYIESFNQKHRPGALMELVPWEEATQWSVVQDADIVLVPSDLSAKAKAAKSANRLTDALHAGRYVVASPLPAYEAFRAYVSLTDDPVQAVRDYLAQPAQAMEKLSAGQIAVRTRHDAAQIATEWLRAFRLKSGKSTVPQHPQALASLMPAAPKAMVRLNLGCGDKILPGYVNVDVVEARAGKSPDVICDLHELSCFENDHADEIMAIHVVEHFWRWEIEAILREWLRVLKPGGSMVLECPNLLSACQALLAEPELRSRQDKAGQTSMWVFYGDPGWKDPLMIHRWGYTPHSLAQLMQSVGMVNVRQEAAVYKLREPRDMRLVGEKPFVGGEE
ncbi:methyltransferase domain-containing protein [Polaromonas sp.]|uniref:methyltransferase domain-containing protein n=1 Tax=Polaromonas sp. TaxID=1869339 RepID=UPI00375269D3